MLSRRLFSTSSKQLAKASVSKLPNGITVVTKNSGASAKNSSIGLYLNSGSRSENPYNSGVSALLGNMVTGSKTAKDALDIDGVKVFSSIEKEVTGLLSTSFAPGNTAGAFKSIKNLLSELESITKDDYLVKEQKGKSISVAENFEKSPRDMVIEHMIATAFQGTSLALPKYGKIDTLSILEAQDVQVFLKKNFVSSNLALVGVGSDLEHENLVKFAQELSIPNGVKPSFEPAAFLGSDARFRDDNLPQAHAAISVKVPSVKDSGAFYTGLVATQINGAASGIDSPFTPFLGSRLSQFLHENHLVDSFDHFQLNYSDVALWGAYLSSSNIANFDETVHFTLKNWNRFSTGTVNQIEFEKAKAELKLNLFKPLNCNVLASKTLANQVFLNGYIASDEEVSSAIDRVTPSDLSKWAQAYLWDQDIAVSGNGQIEALFDYNRLRNDMSLLRW